MAIHDRQQPPSGHGEVLCAPRFGRWAELAEANRAQLEQLPGHLLELRRQARAEAVTVARDYSSALHVEPLSAAPEDLLVMTGHQPELYHPGVWVKDFLVQRFADENGALAVDLVVDTDEAGLLEMRTPCLAPEVRVCRTPIADPGAGVAYVQAPVPDADTRARLRENGVCSLDTLRAPALGRHFATFCDALDSAASLTSDLGSCMTAARRLYERPAGTDYLELAMSAQCRSESYLRFVSTILLDAARFRDAMNSALSDYRRRTGTRSSAQPFPDLGAWDDKVDTPFWLLSQSTRQPLSVDARGTLYAADEAVAAIGKGTESVIEALHAHDLLVAPKAIALTLFERLFVADLFVHGTGGGRYDRVTDAVMRDYFDVEPPAFAVASMTMLLPLGAPLATDHDIASLEQRIHRFTHNPDQILDEVEFDTVEECALAERLARDKRELVEAISRPGADRKALGAQIRDTNESFGALLGPMVAELNERLELLRAERDAADVLTDRTYPYCLWDPREVMDKVR